MKDASLWTVPKWPFIAANVTQLVVTAIVIGKASHPITSLEFVLAIASVMLGALLGCLPFMLEYRATNKLIEINAVSTVAEQLQGLKAYSAQVGAATEQWMQAQEATRINSEKTVTAARDIAERMAAEIRDFNEFQSKLNDTEKNALRLEVDKLRRTEGEWLQVVVRMLDHIFALHTAAAHSGQAELAAQIGQFQNACRDAARRVGLTPFEAAAEEKFDSERHRVHGVEQPPAEGIVAETLASGLTFQSRLIRPALVRLREAGVPATPEPAAGSKEMEAAEAEPNQLTLETE